MAMLYIHYIENQSTLLEVCAELGVLIANHKTEGPASCLVFLGIDTVANERRLPAIHNRTSPTDRKTQPFTESRREKRWDVYLQTTMICVIQGQKVRLLEPSMQDADPLCSPPLIIMDISLTSFLVLPTPK